MNIWGLDLSSTYCRTEVLPNGTKVPTPEMRWRVLVGLKSKPRKVDNEK